MDATLVGRLTNAVHVPSPSITVASTEAQVENWLAANIYEPNPHLDPDLDGLEKYWDAISKPVILPRALSQALLRPRRPFLRIDKAVEVVEFIMRDAIGPAEQASTPQLHFSRRVAVASGSHYVISDLSSTGAEPPRREHSISFSSLEGEQQSSDRMSSPSGNGASNSFEQQTTPGSGIYKHERFHNSSPPPTKGRRPSHDDREQKKSGSLPTGNTGSDCFETPAQPHSAGQESLMHDGGDTCSAIASCSQPHEGVKDGVTTIQEKATRSSALPAVLVGFDAEWLSHYPRNSYDFLFLPPKQCPIALMQIALPTKVLLVSLIKSMGNARSRHEWYRGKKQITPWDIYQARQRSRNYKILDWRRMPLLRDMLTNPQVRKIGEALNNDERALLVSGNISLKGAHDLRKEMSASVKQMVLDFFGFVFDKTAVDIVKLRKGDWTQPTDSMLDYAAADALAPLLVYRHTHPDDVGPPPSSTDAKSSAVEILRKRNKEATDLAQKVHNDYVRKRRPKLGIAKNTRTVEIRGAPSATPMGGADIYVWSSGLEALGDRDPGQVWDPKKARIPEESQNSHGDAWERGIDTWANTGKISGSWSDLATTSFSTRKPPPPRLKDSSDSSAPVIFKRVKS